jgi:hypothetical protein
MAGHFGTVPPQGAADRGVTPPAGPRGMSDVNSRHQVHTPRSRNSKVPFRQLRKA